VTRAKDWSLQIAGDGREGRRQVGPDKRDRTDDHHRDQRGDQAVLDGRGAVFFDGKLPKQIQHLNTPLRFERDSIAPGNIPSGFF
jgi:hypothetical protein